MGANLIPAVNTFLIGTEPFVAGDGSVADGCVTPGSHRLLRFNMYSCNVGDADFRAGKPVDHPGRFVFSSAHGHWHYVDFNKFQLISSSGEVTAGTKQGFCLEDITKINPDAGPPSPVFQCDPTGHTDQGVSAGWADLYSFSLACQFIVIDGLSDGDYTFQATTNANLVDRVPEDSFNENTVSVGLRIQGSAVTVLAPLGDPFPGDPVVEHTWVTIRDGRALTYLGGNRVLDWEPTTGHTRIWNYNRLQF